MNQQPNQQDKHRQLRPVDLKLAEIGAFVRNRPETMNLTKKISTGELTEIMASFARAIRDKPLLVGASDHSLADCLTDAVAYGLCFGDECHMIPRRIKGELAAVFQIGYGGYLRLIRQAGARNVKVRVVREGDEFEVELGDEERMTHKMSTAPNRDTKAITHVYATCILPDGDRAREVWEWGKIEAHRNKYSDAYKKAERDKTYDSAWHTSPEGQGKKTVLIALAKYLPKTSALAKAAGEDEEGAASDIIDAAFSIAPGLPAASQKPAPKSHPTSESSQGKGTARQKQQTPPQREVEPEDSEPAGGLSDGAHDRLEALALDLGRCEQVTDVDARLATAVSASESVDEQAEAERYAEHRRREIRDSRGERSNAQKQKTLAD